MGGRLASAVKAAIKPIGVRVRLVICRSLAASAWPKGQRPDRLVLSHASPHLLAMPLDLTDDEKAALIELLRGTIDRDRITVEVGP